MCVLLSVWFIQLLPENDSFIMVVPEVLSVFHFVCIKLRMSMGVSWISGVMVQLSTSVCNACLSSPMNITFICFHLFCLVEDIYIDVQGSQDS